MMQNASNGQQIMQNCSAIFCVLLLDDDHTSSDVHPISAFYTLINDYTTLIRNTICVQKNLIYYCSIYSLYPKYVTS